MIHLRTLNLQTCYPDAIFHDFQFLEIEGFEQSQAREYANEVIDRASSEMHHYYTYEMHLPNYASRLINLSKIVSAINYQSEERKKIATMAQIFNLFTYDYSDCQIIDH